VKTYFHRDALEYQQYYEGNDIEEIRRKLRRRNDWNTYTSVLDALFKNDDTIDSAIDIGCGIGNVLFELVWRKKFATIVGVDFLRETMRIPHEQPRYFGSVQFLQGDVVHLPFTEKSFDLTICFNMLHHIYEDDVPKALEELARITKKYLLVEIRNKDNVLEPWYENRSLRKKYSQLPQYPLSLSEVQHILGYQGFTRERIKGRLPATWMCRRLVCVYIRR